MRYAIQTPRTRKPMIKMKNPIPKKSRAQPKSPVTTSQSAASQKVRICHAKWLSRYVPSASPRKM